MDIFDFWAQMPEGDCVHPADKEVLCRIKHSFFLECFPGPYRGPLKTANVVLLFLSPGLGGAQVDHAGVPGAREYYSRQKSGQASLPDATEHREAKEWIEKVIRQFGVDYEEARASGTLAILNIGAYKSKSFPDWPSLAALPSSRACLDWAQTVLFRDAELGKRVVVCLRSHDYWGLGTGPSIGRSLFRPNCNRSGFVLRAEREQVTRAVQDAVRGAL